MAELKHRDSHIDLVNLEAYDEQLEAAIEMPRAQQQRRSTSKLRFQCLAEPVAVECQYRVCQKPQRVSATEADRSLIVIYYLAKTAREKLRREAGKHDHRLSRLVGHAGLLDIIIPEIEREELAGDIDRIQEENKAVFNRVRNSVIAGRHQKERIDHILDDGSWNGDLEDQSDDEVYDESDDDIYDDRSSSSEESEPWDVIDELCAAVEREGASLDEFAFRTVPASTLCSTNDAACQFARDHGVSYITNRDSVTTSDSKSKQAEVTISPITVMAEL